MRNISKDFEELHVALDKLEEEYHRVMFRDPVSPDAAQDLEANAEAAADMAKSLLNAIQEEASQYWEMDPR
jgi:hypothetical protein